MHAYIKPVFQKASINPYVYALPMDRIENVKPLIRKNSRINAKNRKQGILYFFIARYPSSNPKTG